MFETDVSADKNLDRDRLGVVLEDKTNASDWVRVWVRVRVRARVRARMDGDTSLVASHLTGERRDSGPGAHADQTSENKCRTFATENIDAGPATEERGQVPRRGRGAGVT